MSAVPASFQHDDCRALQMLINEKTRCRPPLIVDGDIGPKTVTQLKALQTKVGLPASGVYDDALDAIVGVQLRTKYLQDEHYEEAARMLSLSVAHIRTVVEVEAAGDGFLPDGRCDILFERHKFYSFIAQKYGDQRARELHQKFPNICSPNTGGYMGNEKEYSRLEVAEQIDQECAHDSASWGMFQIMGFNSKVAGYPTAVEFSADMQKSERNQLLAFVRFVKAQPAMHQALKDRNWAEFARRYNGPAYLKNKYDVRLATAYGKFKAKYA